MSEPTRCALCGVPVVLGRPTLLTVGYPMSEKVRVCEDSSACRRRAIEQRRGKGASGT